MIEAMECGLPIVSFESPCGPKDIITDGVDGYLVPNYDTELFAKRIISIADNSSKRIEMGIKAKEKSSIFDNEKIMNEWKNLFNETIRIKHN